MYGRYTKDLGEYAKDEARKLKILERRRKQEDKIRNKVIYKHCLYFLIIFIVSNDVVYSPLSDYIVNRDTFNTFFCNVFVH